MRSSHSRGTYVVSVLAAALAMALMQMRPAAAASGGVVTRVGGAISYQPTPGANNKVTFYSSGTPEYMRISDPGGITAGFRLRPVQRADGHLRTRRRRHRDHRQRRRRGRPARR